MRWVDGGGRWVEERGEFFSSRDETKPRTKRFLRGHGFYPVYLTDETVYLLTTGSLPSRPQAVLLVEICDTPHSIQVSSTIIWIQFPQHHAGM
jgi:hypothetical protein